MRKNSSLPSIREKEGSSQGVAKKQETFRVIESKVNWHDQEIVKNEKVISALANEFKLLKEQLQFEQEYSDKYKDSLTNYQQENARYLKTIKEQKATISTLENELQHHQTTAQTTHRHLTLQLQHHQAQLDQAKKDLTNKEAHLRSQENQKAQALQLLH